MIVAYIEFIITVIHTVILALVYSAILLAVLLILANVSKAGFLSGIKKHKKTFWTAVAFIFFIGLISYRFSYNRDNGFGETVQVPIGYEHHVFCSDGSFVYFYPVDDGLDNPFYIGNYSLKENKLCAEVSHKESSYSPNYDYTVYNMKTRKIQPFATTKEYSQYALSNSLPLPDEFREFPYYYKKFSARPEWQKWLLP